MPIVDNAVYVDGHRTADPSSLEQTFELVEERHGFGWIGLYRPSEQELRAVADEFALHPLAVEDALEGHQRPKLERYGENRFIVLRPAQYDDQDERVDFGEVHLFIGPRFAVVIRQAEAPDLKAVRKRLEDQPDLLAVGGDAVLYAVADRIVDDYLPVVAGLQNDIDEIEDQLFGSDRNVSQRIYELSREVMLFQRAVDPLAEMITEVRSDLEGDERKLEVRRGLRDVLDHVARLQERIESFRVLLQNALTVNATLVGQRQNDQMARLTESSLKQGDDVKRVSSWAAIGFAPALIASVYGMNFRSMPELTWRYGYPYALVLMAGVCVFLYIMFRRRDWL